MDITVSFIANVVHNVGQFVGTLIDGFISFFEFNPVAQLAESAANAVPGLHSQIVFINRYFPLDPVIDVVATMAGVLAIVWVIVLVWRWVRSMM